LAGGAKDKAEEARRKFNESGIKERVSTLATDAKDKFDKGVTKLSETQAVKDVKGKIGEGATKIADTQVVKDARKKINSGTAKIPTKHRKLVAILAMCVVAIVLLVALFGGGGSGHKSVSEDTAAQYVRSNVADTSGLRLGAVLEASNTAAVREIRQGNESIFFVRFITSSSSVHTYVVTASGNIYVDQNNWENPRNFTRIYPR